jgi:hypothetical protein
MNNPISNLFPVDKFDVKVHHYTKENIPQAAKYLKHDFLKSSKYYTEVRAFPRDGSPAAYGFASCSKRDVPCRKRGLNIALGRAFKHAKEMGYV